MLLDLCNMLRCWVVVFDSGFWYISIYWFFIVLCFIWFLSWWSCVKFNCLGFLMIMMLVLGMFMFILIMVVVINKFSFLFLKLVIICVFFVGFKCLCIKLMCKFGSVVWRVIVVFFVVWYFNIFDLLINVYI